MKYDLLPHQQALINSVFEYPDITYFFDIAGYGSGKSQGVVFLLLALNSWYQGEYLTFGIGGAAIKHLRETVIKDLLRVFDMHKMPYKHNSQTGLITIGTLEFVYFSMDMPDSIFGWNFSAVIVDELDELEDIAKVKVSMLAVQERTRVLLPKTAQKPEREPFIACTTTAQGLRGTFFYLDYLYNQRVPYVHIRGRTQDNKYLAPSQVALLKKLYTAEEARAFMDGEFINLSTGRVYAEYNPDKNNYMSFDVLPSDHLYVGQDFNPGFNAAVVCLMRAGRIYVISEHRWGIVGDAPRQLRLLYPDNKITMIPDVSGKEIMRGYFDEFERYAIEVVWGNVNPSITERILVVNKLFRTQKMFLFHGVKQLEMGLRTRGFDSTTGKPAKGHGPDAMDHHADSLEYATWHIVHSINAFQEILMLLRGDKAA